MPTIEQVTYNSPDGATMGNSITEKISFYGVTPIVQRSGSAQVTLTLTTIATADSGWMFKTSDGMVSLFAQVEEIRAALVAVGLIKGAA